jgi:hypothetical protein
MGLTRALAPLPPGDPFPGDPGCCRKRATLNPRNWCRSASLCDSARSNRTTQLESIRCQATCACARNQSSVLPVGLPMIGDLQRPEMHLIFWKPRQPVEISRNEAAAPSAPLEKPDRNVGGLWFWRLHVVISCGKRVLQRPLLTWLCAKLQVFATVRWWFEGCRWWAACAGAIIMRAERDQA